MIQMCNNINNNNNNNNNNNSNIYSAVIIAEPQARVHSVHAISTETAPGGRRPLEQANRLESQARL